jgi:DNA-3-methyladenine glycosylase II
MVKKAREHFKKHDPVLFSYFDKIELDLHKPPADLFAELCDTIINQQLSGKAAATIFSRFKKLFPKGKITAQGLLKLKDDKIRSCGTSNAKVKSLKDLAQKVVSGELKLNKLKNLSDEKVAKELIKVKGIGPWSAEMFLMFGLGREDVFSYGDLGLRNAIKKMYGFKKDPSQKQIEKIVSKWKPFRTHASRILWRSLELK